MQPTSGMPLGPAPDGASPRPRASLRAVEVVLAVAAIAWIGALFAAFHPLWQGDSGGYTLPGCAMWGPLPIDAWDGARTPLYPLLLSALQHLATGSCLIEPGPGVLELVTFVQLALYLASLAVLYRALAPCGRLVRVGAMALVLASPLHALFARQLLTESVAASLVNLFLAHLLRFALQGRSRRDATMLFILVTLSTLTRVNFLLVPGVPVLAYVLWVGTERRTLVVRATALVGVPLLALAAFNGWNQRHFRLTNFAGFQATHVAYDLFDRVHPRDAVLGAIMSRQHARDVEAGNADGQVVWRCMAELREHLDEMPYRKLRGPGTSDLNAYLDRVSTYLILENPGTVVGNTARTFAAFWDPPPLPIPAHGDDPRSPGHAGPRASEAGYALFLRAQAPFHALVRACVVLVPLLLAAAALRRGGAGLLLPAGLYGAYLANWLLVSVFNVVQVRYVALLQPLLFVALGLAVRALRAAPSAGRDGAGARPPACDPVPGAGAR